MREKKERKEKKKRNKMKSNTHRFRTFQATDQVVLLPVLCEIEVAQNLLQFNERFLREVVPCLFVFFLMIFDRMIFH